MLIATAQSNVRSLVDLDDLECMSLNLYHESRNESTAGNFLVGFTVLNRVRSNQFPNTVCEVIKQGLHKGGYPVRNRCQFSWYCDGINDVPRNLRAYQRSKYLAEWMLLAKDWLVDISDGSLYYHAYYVAPKWSKFRKKTVQVDSHIFYK